MGMRPWGYTGRGYGSRSLEGAVKGRMPWGCTGGGYGSRSPEGAVMGMRPGGYMQEEAREVGEPKGGCHGNEAMRIYAGGGYGSRSHKEVVMGMRPWSYAGGGEEEEGGRRRRRRRWDFHLKSNNPLLTWWGIISKPSQNVPKMMPR